MPEANFWFNLISKNDLTPDDLLQELMENTDRCLRELRNSCGGCSIKLEGDRRQYCRQCRTYCYCSRECQKLHWNRTGGHRSECMAVRALKEKMKTKSHSADSSAK